MSFGSNFSMNSDKKQNTFLSFPYIDIFIATVSDNRMWNYKLILTYLM